MQWTADWQQLHLFLGTCYRAGSLGEEDMAKKRTRRLKEGGVLRCFKSSIGRRGAVRTWIIYRRDIIERKSIFSFKSQLAKEKGHEVRPDEKKKYKEKIQYFQELGLKCTKNSKWAQESNEAVEKKLWEGNQADWRWNIGVWKENWIIILEQESRRYGNHGWSF